MPQLWREEKTTEETLMALMVYSKELCKDAINVTSCKNLLIKSVVFPVNQKTLSLAKVGEKNFTDDLQNLLGLENRSF